MEAEELYPPRFVIDVCGTQAHTTGQVWINFSGMENEFKSELILDANRGNKAHSVRCYDSDNIIILYLGSHAPPFVQSREFVSEPALSTQVHNL